MPVPMWYPTESKAAPGIVFDFSFLSSFLFSRLLVSGLKLSNNLLLVARAASLLGFADLVDCSDALFVDFFAILPDETRVLPESFLELDVDVDIDASESFTDSLVFDFVCDIFCAIGKNNFNFNF